MNCQEAINLWSSYRDGELDAAFCGEIQNHLAVCADCRRFFEAQERFDDALTRSLQRGQATASLWRRQESAIRAAFEPRASEPGAVSFWAGLLWPGRAFYGALAALWVALLAANWMADANGAPPMAPPPASRQDLLAEQRREFRSLLMATDYEQPQPATLPLGPQSRSRPAPGRPPFTLHRPETAVATLS